MNIPRFTSTAFLTLLASSAMSFEISGHGWGDSEAASKRDAMIDISSRISTTIRNKSKTTETVSSSTSKNSSNESVARHTENVTESSTEFPILGAEFFTHRESGNFSTKAILDSVRSLPLYEQKMNSIRDRIILLNADIDTPKPAETFYSSIMNLLTLHDEFRKLNTVISYLGGSTKEVFLNEETLRTKLRSVMKQVDTLDFAATVLSADINESGVYIYPARTRDSNEVTPFASLLKDKLSTHIKIALNPKDAIYYLSGEYVESTNGIDVTYHLTDSNSSAIKTSSVRLARSAYAGLQTRPQTTDFEKLLKSGLALSDGLRANITTNRGSHDLLFTEGDEVELLIKLSEMGYFYVVGHTLKGKENNSYLVELSEAPDKRKFVHFVNADDANKWISIGKFQVSPPFGVEGLQVVASNKDLIDSLPTAKQDKASGLYLVSAAAKDGVIKTRALVKKVSDTTRSAETSLLFTTREK